MKRKVGLYGGSFDPIHWGHIHLALELKEKHQLDQVLFCPAFCSPFKTATPPIASAKHRFEMVRLAVEDIPGCEALSMEIDRQGPSYAIDTVRALSCESLQLHLLLSEETAQHFDLWKDAFELTRLAPPLIGTRGERPMALPSSLKEPLRKGLTATHVIDISSTQVRQRLRQNLYCGHLVPRKALDYILAHHLYLP